MSPNRGLPSSRAVLLLGFCAFLFASANAEAGDAAFEGKSDGTTVTSNSADQGPISPPVKVTKNTNEDEESGSKNAGNTESSARHKVKDSDLSVLASKAMKSLSTSGGGGFRAAASDPSHRNGEVDSAMSAIRTSATVVENVGAGTTVKESQDHAPEKNEPETPGKSTEKELGASVITRRVNTDVGKVATAADVSATEGEASPAPNTEAEREKLYRSLLVGYSKLERPIDATDPKSTLVNVSMKFNKLWDLSQRDMTFYANIRLILTWKDTNLAFAANDAGGSDKIMADKDDIWVPPYFFKNSEKRKVVIDETSIKSDGTVTYMARLTIKFFTGLELAAFPFDTQHLVLMLGTFGEMEENIRFDINSFEFNGLTCKSSLWEFKTIEASGSDENKQVNVEVVIRRKIGNFFFKSFLPMVVIVLSSSGSFWIDPVSAVPARVAVCVTTMLTTISFYYTVTKDLPRISLPTWMDIWVDMSLFFVFTTLFEFIIVHMYRRMLTQRETHLEQGTKAEQEDEEASLLTARATEIKMKRARLENSTGVWIDRFSRIWHPVAYTLLNTIMLALALLGYYYGGNIRYPW